MDELIQKKYELNFYMRIAYWMELQETFRKLSFRNRCKRFMGMEKSDAIKSNVNIFAVGGGGFTYEQNSDNRDRILEDYLLTLSSPHPNIGYIGHASNDDPVRLSAFFARFEGAANPSHLSVTADVKAAKAFVDDLDILYVGGGSTLNMLSHWRKTGIASVLMAAGQHGMILSGVSAGAICWFEQLLLSAEENVYVLAAGLGLISGSACPHYSNDLSRQIAYDTQIRMGNLLSGVAIDDGVGVHIINGVVAKVVRTGAGNAYFVKGRSADADRPACDEIGDAYERKTKCDVALLKAGDELVF